MGYEAATLPWYLRARYNEPGPSEKLSFLIFIQYTVPVKLILLWIDYGRALVAQNWTATLLEHPIEPPSVI